MQIAICDDEIGTCSDIENMILDYAHSHAMQIETEVFYSGESLYHSVEKQCIYDLIFLDIQLMALDGVQIGILIRERLNNEKVSIVYISSNETYAMSLFQVRPLDFLIKPITREKIASTLDKFIRLREINKQEFYYKVGKSVCRLYLDEIRYFACNGKKIEVYFNSGKDEFYGGMREVWKQVEGKGFLIIHKSYNDRGGLLIDMQNNYSINAPAFETSEGHGFGLKNIRRIAEKYHGNLTTTYSNGNFQACVLLFLATEKVKI